MSIWDILSPPPKEEPMPNRMPQNVFVTPGADPLFENHDGAVGAHLIGDGTYWTAKVSLFGFSAQGISRSQERAKAYALEDIARQLMVGSQPKSESEEDRERHRRQGSDELSKTTSGQP